MARLEVRTASITSISELIGKKEISPVEVIDAFLERIEAVQKKINAYSMVSLWRPRTFSLRQA
jgi:Asp-tRNA(Asn)/Glu-tRNA(Gln) amidotransferase A subunit family amidase